MTMFDTGMLEAIKKAQKAAVLTGAGVSAESGVPTFRGQDGLWKHYRAEELATAEAFSRNPDLVWEWYCYRKNLISKVSPNAGHYALVKMEKYYRDFTLITQNVDDLHRQAGSQIVLELHGNIRRNYCWECGRQYEDDQLELGSKVNKCNCGGYIRPGVVWFGESLPEQVLESAFRAAEDCEVFFSIGTSAVVYPAAMLPHTARRAGALVIEINPVETALTPSAHHFLQGPSGEVLPQLLEEAGI